MVSAEFEASAPSTRAAPPADLPEVAIGGRSNVGKSSLINALVGQRNLARVSRTPGRTQLLNFMRVRLRDPQDEDLMVRLVDLPGYGYAATGKRVQQGFAPMIGEFLTSRPSLRGMILLVDARRELGDRDRQLLEFMTDRGLPTLLVATKVDKLGRAERGKVARRLAAEVGVSPRDVLLTSATDRTGLGEGGLATDLALLCAAPEPTGS